MVVLRLPWHPSNEIKSNNASIGVGGKNNIFDIDIASNKIINAIPFVGNIKVSKFAKNKVSGNSYYLLSRDKNSNEKVLVADISFKPNELLLLGVNANGTVEWNQKIASYDFKEGYFDFILGEKGDLYLGATFND